MLRRLNFTNRIRIRRADVRITLVEPNGGLRFVADLSRLQQYGLPQESLVFVEAYRQASWMRFDFGRVGALTGSGEHKLTQFDSPEGIRFRIKITPADDDRKLLAEADGIPLYKSEQDISAKQPLLAVKPAELDGEIFRLDLAGAEPLLLISRKAGGYSDIGRSPLFLSLVYPAVLREILVRVLVVDRHDDDTSEDDWQSRWLLFARFLPGMTEMPPSTADDEERFQWIDAAVSSFSRRISAHERFAEFWKEGT